MAPFSRAWTSSAVDDERVLLASPSALVRPMQFDHFEFDPETDRLGEGPQSEVYRAVDTRLGRTVALKILRPHVELDPSAVQRFEREAKHTSSLTHANIATIFDYGQARGTSYIVMEYLEGRTLDKLLQNQRLSFEEGIRIGAEVCSALALVHQKGLVHRDLKPANIMVLEDGHVKLLDFGICRSGNESQITQSGMLVGTVLYMAPEQVRGDDIDARTDVFALGSVLYHALTGALPFPGRSFPEVCMAILDGSPLRPSEHRSGFPPPLEDFLLTCLARDPAKRYVNGGAAHAALLAVSENLRGSGPAAKSARIRGALHVLPIDVAPAEEYTRLLAAGVRKDLQAELERSTQLAVTLSDSEVHPTNGAFVLKGRLEVAQQRGTLDFTIERANATRDGETTELWREHIDVSDNDEWGLQAQLVGSIARSVRRRLAQATDEVEVETPPDPQKAREFCVHGHEVLHRGTTKHLLAAVSSFRRALDVDPANPLALAGLAECLVRKYMYWDGDMGFVEEAIEKARRALALMPDCAEAHTSLGFAYQVTGAYSDAQREYRVAIQIDQDEWLAHRLLGALKARLGNLKSAAPLLRRAIALRPTHIGSYDHLYDVLKRLDRYEEALEVAERAIQVARKHVQRVPDDQEARLHLAMILARMGLADDARKELELARARAPKDGYTAFHAACTLCLLGDADAGLAALLEAQTRGFYVQSEIGINTDLDCLRGRPEFAELEG